MFVAYDSNDVMRPTHLVSAWHFVQITYQNSSLVPCFKHSIIIFCWNEIISDLVQQICVYKHPIPVVNIVSIPVTPGFYLLGNVWMVCSVKVSGIILQKHEQTRHAITMASTHVQKMIG